LKQKRLKTAAFFQERAVQGDHDNALSILESVKKQSPISGDELQL